MRRTIRHAVGAIVPPTQAARAEAAAQGGRRVAHDRYLESWPCLNTVEAAAPPDASEPPARMTVAAWNIERCKWIAPSAGLIGSVGADIVLATELDYGMARSGQHHTAVGLAAALGFGYVFGVEFVELGLGDVHETTACAGQQNLHGLHGNAILSRYPLLNPTILPLDDGGAWYVASPKGDGQHRVGGRIAIAAQVETANGPVTLAAAHYESESTGEIRALQTERLLAELDAEYGDGPCVIGGDLNTKGFLDAGVCAEEMMAQPGQVERSFDMFAHYGFDWRNCNTGQVTTRLPAHAPPGTPLKTLDWLFVRDVTAHAPFVAPALSERGDYLSDHEMVCAVITP